MNKKIILAGAGFLYLIARLLNADKSGNIYEFFVNVLGSIPICSDESFTNTLIKTMIWIFPQVVCCFVFATTFEDNIKSNVPLIFTRTSKVNSVINKEVVKLVREVIISTLCMIVVVLAISFGIGAKITPYSLCLIAIDSINICVFMCFICVFINLLSLILSSSLAIIIALFLELSQVILIINNAPFQKYLLINGVLLEHRIQMDLWMSLQCLGIQIGVFLAFMILFNALFKLKKELILME